MSKEKKEYQQVFKATSLFGGVQLIQIIISALKTKVVAIFLGPSGMGIYRLLQTTVNMVGKFTDFGLPTSAVKYISFEFAKGNEEKAYRYIQILQNLLWITGILGAAVLMLASPFLSELLFDSQTYTYAFIWQGTAVLFNQLANGRISILQSLRKLSQLAKANLYGSAIGLILIAPLYYFFGEKAIVPAIILGAGINVYFSWFFLTKNRIPKIKISPKESYTEGKGMLKLGIVLSFTSLTKALSLYLLQLYINEVGGVGQVGLYSAGFLILETYGGLIFTAMTKDYYPRLAGVAMDENKVRETVKHQAFIAVLLMLPVIALFLTLAPQLIRLLLSTEFTVIVQMVSWGIIGLLFKAVAWSISYIMVAKGHSRIFAITDISFIVVQLAIYALGYYFGGLTGLGISYLLYHILYLIGIYWINYLQYKFYFTRDFYGIFLICIAFCVAIFGLSFIENPLWHYVSMSVLTLLSIWFSVVQLNKKIDFKELVDSFLSNRNSKK